MKKSRTQNSLVNFITGVGGQLMVNVVDFVVRTIFIHTLGKTYLGINGLFSNILTMLSLAELGVGSAILYKLYKPLADDDQKRVAVLMAFYKRMYTIIGIIIGGIGLLLVPFLPMLIKDGYAKYSNLNLNLTFIYLLFLFRTVSTYIFFAYRSAIIKANQQEYIVNVINVVVTLLTAVVRAVVLLLLGRSEETKSLCFIIYIVIAITGNLVKNILYAVKSNKVFPYLKQGSKEKLSWSEQKAIFKDCGALMIYKANTVVVKGTDNIIISGFLGLDVLALYSNYYLFYKTLTSFIQRVYGSVAHSIGNLHATQDVNHQYRIFSELHLITAVLSGTMMVGLAVVGDTAIRAWIGNNWVFHDQPVALMIGIESYTLAYRQFLSRHRHAMGLFQQAKWRPLFAMVINLVVSILMVQVWGVCGVLLGTIVSEWATMLWYDPLIIHKYGFKLPGRLRNYYLDFLVYFLVSVVVMIFDYWLCSVVLPNHGWLSFVVHMLICAVTVPAALLAVFWNAPERKRLTDLMKHGALKFIAKFRRKKSQA